MLLKVPFLTQRTIDHLLGSSSKKTDSLIYTQICVTGALQSEEGLALSKLGLTYGGLKDM
ncbi:hypothetical protein O181_117447, partial [Austropuccinia psidii MF-1]|nr:hypothetical protein [Austropuccinia psidii MF-1]